MRFVHVHGIVRGVDGEPVSGGNVGATSRTAGVSVPEIAAMTGEDGAWGLPVAPDALYTFSAHCHDSDSDVRRGQTEVMIQAGREPDLIEIVVS